MSSSGDLFSEQLNIPAGKSMPLFFSSPVYAKMPIFFAEGATAIDDAFRLRCGTHHES
jgi:hypothetical protein